MGRQQLLEAIVADVARHGFADRSLRDLATAVGSSHRMLHYHFGSREGLLEAIVIHQLDRARDDDAELFDFTTDDDGLDARWRRSTTPEERAFDLLFFELVAMAARGGEETARFRAGYIEPWLQLSEHAARRFGLDADASRATTRLDVAVLVGLALDRLLTDDDAGVQAAFDTYAEMRRPSIERARAAARRHDGS
ncbi:MAG: TetR/AcrR family transcriptional regulator [Actinomycetota bacterium]